MSGKDSSRLNLFEHSDASKYFGEFIGTYFLVLTVGCNVLTGSVGAALSIGAILMAMIFAIGPVSGAHLNPAVTLAVFISTNMRPDSKFSVGKPLNVVTALVYVAVQLLAGIVAGWSYVVVCGNSFSLAPIGRFHWQQAFIAEMLFTAALCYVVLNVATVQEEKNQSFGLAIGFTVTAAAMAIGSVSGCSLNPAVSVGSVAGTALLKGIGEASNHLTLYIVAPVVGACISAALFKAVRPHAVN
mmetsp:Transcript_4687/g.7626  ORF Transcript_4687/g.7626 Transcript_4687/m.7626 type:complete len:243 (-) Transcript_4687:33-761(-)|eukprot:CAMPEP_0169068866 /NCGR_PEP_ID=MMETSP1015-20121227/4257_1 /TAXON_ID=342587 /ORGANISM="Karlodinium micrum, Strain CCMP2283" /LENGTH=242 /DNA_ID=CAMNT_0009127719 /DNA_START=100 /DNA_END=828 /DNA_ORIENTATION=+